MILFKGGASEPYDMRLPDKAGGAVAVRRTLASTICRIADPTQVPRPRQLRDASTVMRFRPAHQSVINRRHDDRVSCLARHSLKQTLERKPRTRLPATWNGGHESGKNLTEESERDSPGLRWVRVWGMRKDIVVDVSAADRARLEAIVTDRNSPQKHVWRARIVLLTGEDLGTVEIMRRTGKSKTCVWRWQERFMQAGVDGLLRDKTRPSRIPPLGAEVAARVVALTQTDPLGETTHWTAGMMAKTAGISVSSVQRIWRAHGLQPHRVRQFKLSTDPHSPPSCATSSDFMSIRRPTPSCSRSTRRAKSRRSTVPS